MSTGIITRRSRAQTEAKLIAAVGTVLARDGFRALGVNALAREADVDKVLIYRYFGSLKGLIAAFAERGDFWYHADEILPRPGPLPREEIGAFIADLFRRHMEALLARPQTLEILAWETVERNALTAALEDVREARSLDLVARVKALLPPDAAIDVPAFGALMGAATNYLAIRSRSIHVFNDMAINTAEGRDRLFGLIAQFAQCLIDKKTIDKNANMGGYHA